MTTSSIYSVGTGSAMSASATTEASHSATTANTASSNHSIANADQIILSFRTLLKRGNNTCSKPSLTLCRIPEDKAVTSYSTPSTTPSNTTATASCITQTHRFIHMAPQKPVIVGYVREEQTDFGNEDLPAESIESDSEEDDDQSSSGTMDEHLSAISRRLEKNVIRLNALRFERKT